MAVAAVTQGTIFAYNNTGYVTIARLVSLTPGEVTRGKIDTSDLSVSQETSLMGIVRYAPWSFVINNDFSGTPDIFLWTQFYTTNTYINWKITLTNGTPSNFVILGAISGFQLGAATVDGIQRATVKVQPSAAMTITA